MSDSLRNLVDARDRALTEPKALQRLSRGERRVRRICLGCGHRQTWDDLLDLGEDNRACAGCGATLVEVEW